MQCVLVTRCLQTQTGSAEQHQGAYNHHHHHHHHHQSSQNQNQAYKTNTISYLGSTADETHQELRCHPTQDCAKLGRMQAAMRVETDPCSVIWTGLIIQMGVMTNQQSILKARQYPT
jgi:hypothetical protein